MLADDHLRLLVHLGDEQGQGLVCLALAPAVQDLPQLLPVHSVICFLQVNERCVVPPLLALSWVILSKEPRHLGGCGSALLEACLVDPGLKEMRRQGSHLRHNGLLEDLRHVRPHHDRPDVFEFRLVHPFVPRLWHQSAFIQLLWYRHGAVEQAGNFGSDLLGEPV